MTTLTIPRRFGAGPITVEIDCPEDASLAVKVSAAVRSGADLTGAYLTGALIRGEPAKALIASVNRLIDPYAFLAFRLQSDEVKVLAGCRWFSVSEFRAHVAASYPDTPKATETIRILNYIDACAGDTQ